MTTCDALSATALNEAVVGEGAGRKSTANNDRESGLRGICDNVRPHQPVHNQPAPRETHLRRKAPSSCCEIWPWRRQLIPDPSRGRGPSRTTAVGSGAVNLRGGLAQRAKLIIGDGAGREEGNSFRPQLSEPSFRPCNGLILFPKCLRSESGGKTSLLKCLLSYANARRRASSLVRAAGSVPALCVSAAFHHFMHK